jgi:hypothetical protein
VLGYDIDPRGFRLVVNDAEAARVRAIFDLYLEHQGLRAAVEELDRRGWRTKRWTTRHGRERGGRLFTKVSLHQLLTNVTYIGQVKYKQEIHAGEHPAIIETSIWRRVQETLRQHGRAARALACNPGSALLKGRLRCVPCGSAMTPAHTVRRGHLRYRYYVCSHAQKRGWHTCPSKALPAAAIECLVIDKLQSLAIDPQRLQRAVAETGADIAKNNATGHPLPADGAAKRDRTPAGTPPFAAEGSLTPSEQARLVQLLVARVDYDGVAGTVAIHVQPSGMNTLTLKHVAPPADHTDERAVDS